MNESQCLICGTITRFEQSNYFGYTCKCGQEYAWEESLQIVLTAEQLEYLRKMPPTEALSPIIEGLMQ